jgi:hypothetical protein
MAHILVYGTSILLEGVAAQLSAQADMRVRRRETLADLGDLSAFDAVLVDLNDTGAADVLTMLRVRPDLQILGVNAATGSVTLLAGHVYLTPTVEEVMACLTHITKGR